MPANTPHRWRRCQAKAKAPFVSICVDPSSDFLTWKGTFANEHCIRMSTGLKRPGRTSRPPAPASAGSHAFGTPPQTWQGPGGDCAPGALRKGKHPPWARRPVLPRPRAAVLSAMGGLTAGFGMGPGDPPLRGRAHGGCSHGTSRPARGLPGRPGVRMRATSRRRPPARGGAS